MKNLVNQLLQLLLLMLVTVMPQIASAYDFKAGDLCYNINSDGSTVTVTGENASGGYENLSEDVVIPKNVSYNGVTYTVTAIGEDAFVGSEYGTSTLTSISIPSTVTSIGDYAFMYCTNLTSIEIPEAVTNIGKYAFRQCSKITSINIPHNVTTIGRRAFDGCSSITTITVNDNNTNYDSRNNCNAIIETATNILVAGCRNTVIPNSVTELGERAFSFRTGLTSITIPNSVRVLGKGLFLECSDLISVDMPNSITSIPSNTFNSCTSLSSIIIPSGVTQIGEAAFQDCTSLIKITSEITNPEIVALDYYTFYNVDKENCILYVPKGTVDIYKNTDFWNQFVNILELEESGAGDLTYEIIDSEAKTVQVVEDEKYKTYTDVVIPETTVINGTEYTVTRINYDAFYYCESLTSVSIPNTVTEIGSSAFQGCRSLTSVVLGNSVALIDEDAFYSCSALESIEIPSSVNEIRFEAFHGCRGLNTIVVSPDNQCYDSRNNCNAIIETATNTLITGCKNTIIPNSVTAIYIRAFEDCKGLTSIIIPNSVTSIGYDAFRSSGLISATIGNSVTSIEEGVFSYCTDLTTVKIPSAVKTMNRAAFWGCVNLAEIYLGIEKPQNIIYPDQINPASVFEEVPTSTCTLYVPKGTLQAYQSTSPWSSFSNIVEMNGGDTNGDGECTASDVTALYNLILYNDASSIFSGDQNGDGEITASDITAIYNLILGL